MAGYTEEERSELKSFFESFDKDNNGLLEFIEFAHLVEMLGDEAIGPKLSPEEAQITFDKVDRDGNGSIDFEEFIDWLGKQ